MTFLSFELFFNAPIEEERNVCIFFSFFNRAALSKRKIVDLPTHQLYDTV